MRNLEHFHLSASRYSARGLLRPRKTLDHVDFIPNEERAPGAIQRCGRGGNTTELSAAVWDSDMPSQWLITRTQYTDTRRCRLHHSCWIFAWSNCCLGCHAAQYQYKQLCEIFKDMVLLGSCLRRILPIVLCPHSSKCQRTRRVFSLSQNGRFGPRMYASCHFFRRSYRLTG